MRDTVAGTTTKVESPATRPGQSRSVFNPSLSDDGRRVAFSGAAPDGHTVVWVRDLDSGATALASPRPPGTDAGDAYGGVISGDGGTVAFTWVPRNGAKSHVYVCEVATGRTTLVDRASGADGAPADGFASQPALSHDGRRVAFSSAARNLGAAGAGVHVYLRDLATGTTAAAGGGPAGAFEPALSASAEQVAFVSARGGHARVLLHDITTGRTTALSGAGSAGIALDPAVSADGARVAFASTRTALANRRSAGPRTVYLVDVAAGRTTLISAGPG